MRNKYEHMNFVSAARFPPRKHSTFLGTENAAALIDEPLRTPENTENAVRHENHRLPLFGVFIGRKSRSR